MCCEQHSGARLVRQGANAALLGKASWALCKRRADVCMLLQTWNQSALTWGDIPVGDKGVLPFAGGYRLGADASASAPEEYAGACTSQHSSSGCHSHVLSTTMSCRWTGQPKKCAAIYSNCHIKDQRLPQAALLAH